MPQVRELDLATLRWQKVETGGVPPPYRIHCRCAASLGLKEH